MHLNMILILMSEVDASQYHLNINKGVSSTSWQDWADELSEQANDIHLLPSIMMIIQSNDKHWVDSAYIFSIN